MSISKERPINATRHVPGVSKRGKSVVSYQFLLQYKHMKLRFNENHDKDSHLLFVEEIGSQRAN